MDLVESGSVGGFFALRTIPPEGGGAHRPLARLYAGEDGPLTARVDRVAARLGTPERRVAASIAHLGLAARLWSTAIGPAALYGRFPDLAPGELHWDGALTSPDDLWWSGSATRPATVDELAAVVLEAHLVPLHAALRRDGGISPRLLWGNAGSALAGALRELSRWAAVHRRPDAAERAAALVSGLLARPELAGTVRGPRLRRSSCCLYYRCPGGGLCGDCVFDHAPRTGLEARPPAP
ncbi:MULTISPECIES: (2Fe-2S)-binding protein [Streptomyces]|uniref:Ferric iron reductase n=1 Tax=Streptomyces viridochromogenes TaxID=1938 RepID=A0A0L8JEQ2_STRVR|nr:MULTISPECIES: (2Fe-2S)-binding protein [Streptomyces]KOG12121.1 ferric iron reductase [Streptomyces viridochromogenes]